MLKPQRNTTLLKPIISNQHLFHIWSNKTRWRRVWHVQSPFPFSVGATFQSKVTWRHFQQHSGASAAKWQFLRKEPVFLPVFSLEFLFLEASVSFPSCLVASSVVWPRPVSSCVALCVTLDFSKVFTEKHFYRELQPASTSEQVVLFLKALLLSGARSYHWISRKKKKNKSDVNNSETCPTLPLNF